jgi:hypothetical protein
MTISLTPEQERRIQAVIRRGAYESFEEVVEAALTAVEQLTVPGFAGTQQELDNVSGCGVECGHHTLLNPGGPVVWDSDLRLVQCGLVSFLAHAR